MVNTYCRNNVIEKIKEFEMNVIKFIERIKQNKQRRLTNKEIYEMLEGKAIVEDNESTKML